MAYLMVDTYSAIVFTASLILSSIFAGLFVGLIGKQQQQLETLAVTDALTGLFNRVLLKDHMSRAIEQNRRNNMPMTLLMMDIDYFKTINDTFGHTIGDDVLRALGTYLQQRVRSSDAAFRLGGEEFLILLNNTQAQDAQSIAEEIRKEIAALKLIPDHNVTISIGVAEVQANDDLNNWLKRGDKTLYKAKLAGRNQVASHYVEDQMLQEA
jgi:diguanylate cyclase (GGDEF)-like protein